MASPKSWPVQLTWSIVEERGRTLVAEDDGTAVGAVRNWLGVDDLRCLDDPLRTIVGISRS